jgi:hypothetical protein
MKLLGVSFASMVSAAMSGGCVLNFARARSGATLINTSFGAYLASLLAYKRFRDRWKDLPLDLEYDVQAMQRTAFRPKRFTRIFSPNLKPLTRPAFEGGFWEQHD